MANLIAGSATRPISWIHMPVPAEGWTTRFYAPLEQLHLAATTALYLGLVHVKDGVDGSIARARAALRHRRDFGIASECGISRGRDSNLALDFIDVYAKTSAAL